MTNAAVSIEISVNGKRVPATVMPRLTLADLLRDLGCRSVRLGCEHGVCGACTVLLDGKAIRSCLAFGVQADGRSVETVEGLAEGGALSPLQQSFSDHHALQCGFCTSGFLMLAESLVRETGAATREEVRDVLSSNLCRCTGYEGLVEADTDVVERADGDQQAHSRAGESSETS